MGGQWTVTKPSRSDEVLDTDQQRQITTQIRAQFDSLAPKRPAKPSRSESDSTTPVFTDTDGNNIPELDKLRSLHSQSSVVLSAGVDNNNTVQDEFVETQYYKELSSIDNQHHTTGSGFIKVVKEKDENGYGIQLSNGHDGAVNVFSTYRGNPATNDWIPSSENNQVCISSKPNRSEGS